MVLGVKEEITGVEDSIYKDRSLGVYSQYGIKQTVLCQGYL